MYTIVVFLSVFHTAFQFLKFRTFWHSAQAGSYFICIHEWLISAGADGERQRRPRQTAAGQSDSTRMFLVSNRIQQKDSNSTLRGFPFRCSNDEEEWLHTAQPVWRLTAVAVPLIHRRGRVCRARAKPGGTRWHNKKGGRKSAEQFEERKLLAPTSLTSRKTGAGDVIPSFYDFSALARTPNVSSCKRCFQLKLRQSCNFKTNSQRGKPACYLLPAWF